LLHLVGILFSFRYSFEDFVTVDDGDDDDDDDDVV
jgi:hypothetical protein